MARFRSLYTAKLEIEHAHLILDSNNPWEILTNFSYLQNYIRLASTEYKGAGLKPDDTVVIIGSGPLPISLIMMCHQYGVRGIGIEQETERAELSRKVLEKLG
ncbi:MAG: methyltransferase, partial [Methanosarcinales archaeon]|nr:methyltransferase [Methanosarcinales archaeon]